MIDRVPQNWSTGPIRAVCQLVWALDQVMPGTGGLIEAWMLHERPNWDELRVLAECLLWEPLPTPSSAPTV